MKKLIATLVILLTMVGYTHGGDLDASAKIGKLSRYQSIQREFNTSFNDIERHQKIIRRLYKNIGDPDELVTEKDHKDIKALYKEFKKFQALKTKYADFLGIAEDDQDL